MPNEMRNFDGELQMFREQVRSPENKRLHFIRWLVEQGRLEHLPAGPPSGELAEAAAPR